MASGEGGLLVWWPAFFAVGVMGLMLLVDPKHAATFPPQLELTGAQAKSVLSSPWVLSVVLPMLAGLVWIRFFAKRNKLPAEEHMSMVWWLVNFFWFHTGCDIFSGYWQVMPVLTDLYKHMTPAHHQPRWHESRGHLDAGYVLELFVEVPLAAWVLYLYMTRDPARHIAEVFAASVQLTGTVMYYAPGLAKGEANCWLSWVDRSAGFMWILFPLLLLRRHLAAARPKTNGKSSSGKKKH